MMRKLFFVFLLCITFFSGCVKNAEAPDETAEFPDAVKLSSEIKYFNDYLGISCAVPKGWWFYEVNPDNFGGAAGEITDEVLMDIGYGDFGDYAYSNLWLVSFGNLESSGMDNHLGFYLEAESIEGISDISAFMEYYEAYMLEPTAEEEYELRESEKVHIGGRDFELRDYSVYRGEGDFRVMTLSCAAKNGYFLNVMVDYWPQNAKAKQSVIDTVAKSIAFY